MVKPLLKAPLESIELLMFGAFEDGGPVTWNLVNRDEFVKGKVGYNNIWVVSRVVHGLSS